MSIAMGGTAADAVGYQVPDGIEVIEAWRGWDFDGKTLLSVTHTTPWLPGERIEAKCAYGGQVAGYQWEMVRGGMSREQAQKKANIEPQYFYSSTKHHVPPVVYMPRVPSLEPPAGYGYAIQTITTSPHTAPDKNCTCGIYAADKQDGAYPSTIIGKVSLWGTVVPGDKGFRAQYAYPSELIVPSELAHHPALLAYGVPLVTESRGVTLVGKARRRMPIHPLVAASVAVNLAAAGLNLWMAH